ncbi:MAG: hypothetical protein HZY75_01980 [Nocardioidaceae bacterium]|nr:MAG: hypothetical protein HZY75_01980 [Nocardioidaceae bacterium]
MVRNIAHTLGYRAVSSLHLCPGCARLGRLRPADRGSLELGQRRCSCGFTSSASPTSPGPEAETQEKKKPLKKWTSLSIGEDNSCGITTKQTLWCWGYNSNGELGIGNTKSKYKPVQVKGGGKWLQVSAQDETTCGIKKDGSLWCWGYNAYYAVGDGTDKNRTKPTRVGTAKNWKSISVSFHGCGIKKDNSLWCWGYNNIGQLGTGDYTTAPTPVQVQAGRTWTSVQAGSSSTCALAVNLTDSKKRDLLCWGYGGRGQLGQGTTANSLNPVQVAGNWKSISGANSTVCGVRSDGSGWCWGKTPPGRQEPRHRSRCCPR